MQILCPFDELPENGAKGFRISAQSLAADILVARRDGRIYGYRNVCPHRHTTLDWLPDQFMDPSGEYLQCATHGALFRLEDGLCIAGPCKGQRLTPVTVAVHDDMVVLLSE